jgi:hypothetical protein
MARPASAAFLLSVLCIAALVLPPADAAAIVEALAAPQTVCQTRGAAAVPPANATTPHLNDTVNQVLILCVDSCAHDHDTRAAIMLT